MAHASQAPAAAGRQVDLETPIFVGGLHRSGTTLMARLLGSHSEIAIPPSELGFFEVSFERGYDPRSPVAGRDEFEERLRTLFRGDMGKWGLDEEDLLTRSRELEPTHRNLFALVLEAFRNRAGKRRVGEKTPNYERWLDVLDTWFEDYRFVHVVRNPIDCFASLRWYVGEAQVAPTPSKKVALLPWIHQWNDSATIALRRSNSDRRRYCYVRYEDLADDAAAALERVCRFVGVEPEIDRMLATLGDNRAENSSFAPFATKREYVGGIRRSDDVERRALLEPDQTASIGALCGPLAFLLGYDIAPLRSRRGRLGRLLPGRIPPKVGASFVISRVRERLGRVGGGPGA